MTDMAYRKDNISDICSQLFHQQLDQSLNLAWKKQRDKKILC